MTLIQAAARCQTGIQYIDQINNENQEEKNLREKFVSQDIAIMDKVLWFLGNMAAESNSDYRVTIIGKSNLFTYLNYLQSQNMFESRIITNRLSSTMSWLLVNLISVKNNIVVSQAIK